MKFKSKMEKNAHPQARLIPEELWNDVYRCKHAEWYFNNEMALLMSESLDELFLLKIRFEAGNLKLYLISFLLTHRIFDSEQYDKVLKIIAARPLDVFICAARLGQFKLMQLVLSRMNPDSMNPDNMKILMENCLESALNGAAKSGDIEVVNFLLRWLNLIDRELFDKLGVYEQAFASACEYGHFQIVRRLIDFDVSDNDSGRLSLMLSKTFLQNFYGYCAFRSLLEHGDLIIANYIISIAEKELAGSVLFTYLHDVVRYAAFLGHLEIFNHIFEIMIPYLVNNNPGSNRGIIFELFHSALDMTAKYNFVDYFNKIISTLSMLPYKALSNEEFYNKRLQVAKLLVTASRHNNPAMFNRLIDLIVYDKQLIMTNLAYLDYEAIDFAINNAHFDIIDLIIHLPLSRFYKYNLLTTSLNFQAWYNAEDFQLYASIEYILDKLPEVHLLLRSEIKAAVAKKRLVIYLVKSALLSRDIPDEICDIIVNHAYPIRQKSRILNNKGDPQTLLKRYTQIWLKHSQNNPLTPKLYFDIWNNTRGNNLAKAEALLSDYSSWTRFFTGNWKRQHCSDVDNFLAKAPRDPLLFVSELEKIKYKQDVPFNHNGSFARRLKFIKNKLEPELLVSDLKY